MAEAAERARLREALSAFEAGFRLLAADVLGEGSRIDWIARDAHGRVVVVLAGARGECATLLTRAIAQCAWVEPRIEDWLKLAPALDLDPDASPRCLLVAPGFEAETRAAARALGRHRVELLRLEEDSSNRMGLALRRELAECDAPSADEPLPPFRSGLREADLDLTPEERRQFE